MFNLYWSLKVRQLIKHFILKKSSWRMRLSESCVCAYQKMFTTANNSKRSADIFFKVLIWKVTNYLHEYLNIVQTSFFKSFFTYCQNQKIPTTTTTIIVLMKRKHEQWTQKSHKTLSLSSSPLFLLYKLPTNTSMNVSFIYTFF